MSDAFDKAETYATRMVRSFERQLDILEQDNRRCDALRYERDHAQRKLDAAGETAGANERSIAQWARYIIREAETLNTGTVVPQWAHDLVALHDAYDAQAAAEAAGKRAETALIAAAAALQERNRREAAIAAGTAPVIGYATVIRPAAPIVTRNGLTDLAEARRDIAEDR